MTRSVHGGLARATAQFPSRLVCCQLQAAATSRPAAACMRWLGGASSGVRAGAFPHAHGIFDSAAPRALSRGHGRYSAVRSPERRCINEVTNAYTRAQHKQRALFDANLMLTATSVCGVARARTHARHRPEALVRHRCHRNIVFCRGAPSVASRVAQRHTRRRTNQRRSASGLPPTARPRPPN